MAAMTQTGKGDNPREVRVLQLRLLWPFLLLLAAFVIFFEFIADVGGSADPLRAPPQLPVSSASPTPGTKRLQDPSVAGRDLAGVAEVAEVKIPGSPPRSGTTSPELVSPARHSPKGDGPQATPPGPAP